MSESIWAPPSSSLYLFLASHCTLCQGSSGTTEGDIGLSSLQTGLELDSVTALLDTSLAVVYGHVWTKIKQRICITLTNTFIISPQNGTRCTQRLEVLRNDNRVVSDVLAGVHTFIHAVGINLSVFPAEGIDYWPDS